MPSLMRAVKRRTSACVDIALGQISLLHGIDVGLVIVIVVHFRRRSRRTRCPCRAAARSPEASGCVSAKVVAVEDVDHSAAVGDHVALEAPFAAKLIDKRKLVWRRQARR